MKCRERSHSDKPAHATKYVEATVCILEQRISPNSYDECVQTIGSELRWGLDATNSPSRENALEWGELPVNDPLLEI